MNKKLKETFRKGERPVLTEQAIQVLEKDFRVHGFLTPLHSLYCDFKDEACGSNHCFNKDNYYRNRCIPALCFARWLDLKGYSKFNFNELKDSTASSMIKEED